MSALAVSRRGFIGTLLAGVGAAFVQTPDNFLWKPAEDAALPALQEGAIVGLPSMTQAIAQELGRHWNADRMVAANAIGQDCIRHGYYVNAGDLPSEIDHHGVAERYVVPIAMQFAQMLKRDRAEVAAILPCRTHGVEQCYVASNERLGVSVRGVREYSLWHNAMLTRFEAYAG